MFDLTQEQPSQVVDVSTMFSGFYTAICGSITYTISSTESITPSNIAGVTITGSSLTIDTTTRMSASFYVVAHHTDYSLFASVPFSTSVKSVCENESLTAVNLPNLVLKIQQNKVVSGSTINVLFSSSEIRTLWTTPVEPLCQIEKLWVLKADGNPLAASDPIKTWLQLPRELPMDPVLI